MLPRFTPNQKKSDLTALVERICRRSHGSKPAVTVNPAKKERMIAHLKKFNLFPCRVTMPLT